MTLLIIRKKFICQQPKSSVITDNTSFQVKRNRTKHKLVIKWREKICTGADIYKFYIKVSYFIYFQVELIEIVLKHPVAILS